MTAASADGNHIAFGSAPGGTTLQPGQQFYPLRFSATASASAELAFAGFGISSPERGYDDYRGDVKGRIVLAIDHEPGESDPHSPFDGVVTSQVSDQLWKTHYDKIACGSRSESRTVSRMDVDGWLITFGRCSRA